MRIYEPGLDRSFNLRPSVSTVIWKVVNQGFGYSCQSFLIPSIREGYAHEKLFRVTLVVVTDNLIDVWYLDSLGQERRISFELVLQLEGKIYSEPVAL